MEWNFRSMKRRNACWPLSTLCLHLWMVEGFRSAEDERDFRTVFVSLFHKEDQELAQAGWTRTETQDAQ